MVDFFQKDYLNHTPYIPNLIKQAAAHKTIKTSATTITKCPTIAGKEVGPTGYGVMAISLGANLWSGGELYGTVQHNSLHILHNYFAKHPEKADKAFLRMNGALIPGQLAPDGSEENIRRSVDECLRVLGGVKEVDLSNVHGWAQNTP
ncbi:hypothetical protein AJ78_07702 [Emergomyces pasteurianus Ep9510]|uniref:NADP-dependent oxidoreductase domain-containing protein n=1 Tax=Emergomyces pasteurianus Ep9510 TaxID=1447872 RepID=A0A1J9Q8P3_9EURO|nr:hypothetical protein AJ78_07702 [Emergomyces pasteurianus Ep9510]